VCKHDSYSDLAPLLDSRTWSPRAVVALTVNDVVATAPQSPRKNTSGARRRSSGQNSSHVRGQVKSGQHPTYRT
jgi:hypothetical protein